MRKRTLPITAVGGARLLLLEGIMNVCDTDGAS